MSSSTCGQNFRSIGQRTAKKTKVELGSARNFPMSTPGYSKILTLIQNDRISFFGDILLTSLWDFNKILMEYGVKRFFRSFPLSRSRRPLVRQLGFDE